MADVANYLGEVDKVTQYLRDSTPDIKDVAQAALSATTKNWGGTPTTFGEQLNAIQAGQIKKADDILRLVQNQEKMDNWATQQEAKNALAQQRAEATLAGINERMGLARDKFDLEREKLDLARSRADNRAADWETRDTDQGLVSINRLTKEIVPLGLKSNKSNGLAVTLPDGTQISSGMPVTKTNLNEAGKKGIAAGETAIRLEQIAKNFDPKWLTFKEQGLNWARGIAEKVAPGSLDEGTKANVRNYRKFAAAVQNHVNQIVHDLSGAAVTVQEAERLMKTLPNLDDSPSAFIGKFEGTLENLRLNQEMYDSMLATGRLPHASPEAKRNLDTAVAKMEAMLQKMTGGGNATPAAGPSAVPDVKSLSDDELLQRLRGQ